MKKIVFILISIVLISCVEKKSGATEQVKEFYEGFKNADYNRIKGTIADSLMLIGGDYTMGFNKESYYQQFKWDSIFKPVYNVVAIEKKDQQVVATVAVTSSRFQFLKNNPLTCKHEFYFKSGKISKIEDITCIDVDWEIWQKERDSLVSWVKVNHPKLDGFIYDLSMKGALDYLKAIELYKKSEFKETE